MGELEVPSMALGTMYFGTRVPVERARACLDEAFELGARLWDTANNYAFWVGGVGDESENVIGDWLAAHGSAAREQIVIATKVGARPRTPGAGLEDAWGLSRRAVREQVHECLRRLRVEAIDILYSHVDDSSVPLEETLGVMGELVDEGLVRTVAASNLTAARLAEAAATPAGHPYRALQQRFTYIEPVNRQFGLQVLLDDDVSRLCQEHGITRLGYSPLLSGAYTRSDRAYPEGYVPGDRALEALHEVARRHGLDVGQAVLAWMVSRAQSVIPVVGVSRPEQVASAWHAVGTRLTAEETARLDDARRQ
ncbi:aldo/keto reductase [Actinomyces sp. 432]|uniref:aldo/keto reductase n=1 Tax=Actinomyces sp. 432 TaxID=2057798 RepID=UPI00137450E5|nr:aldo/keto reductase [Actinomyces sp. 432]QHO91997.1 aldo/keto reductase [Actinomyces sp. 432]